MLEVAQVARDVERARGLLFFAFGLPLLKNDVGAVGKPLAGFGEGLAEVAHHEVYGASVGSADEAAEGVASAVVGEAGMVVVVEGAEALVAVYVEPEPFGYALNGERA